MALSDNGRRAIRRAIGDSTLAASIITKFDTPLSVFTTREQQAIDRAFGSSGVGGDIAGKVFIPAAVQEQTRRALRIVSANATIGNHLASELAS